MKRLVLLFACVMATSGCSEELPAPAGSALPPVPGPGATTWNDDDITCTKDTDCNAGEACTDGVCRIQRCAEPAYASVPPLGQTMYFHRDREIVVARGGPTAPRLETYEAVGTTLVSPDDSALWVSGAAPLDLAGGNFLGGSTDVVAIVEQAKKSVRLVAENTDTTFTLGWFPVAVAGGDVDIDGVDEFGVASWAGTLAVCNAMKKTCPHKADAEKLVGTDLLVWDVAMGDVDGDGRAELAFVAWPASSQTDFVVGVYNPDHAETGQAEVVSVQFTGNGKYISAGDTDGDRVDELFVLDDGTWGDQVHWLQIRGGSIASVGSIDVAGDAVDVLGADIDLDERAEVLVLTDSDRVEVYSAIGAPGLAHYFTTALSMTQDAKRLAVLDRDGDSPAGELLEGPRLVPGNLLPLVVALYPPYSREFSDGTASVSIGRNETVTETVSETVSLNASLTVGVAGEIPGVLKAFVGGRIQETVELKHDVSVSVSIADSFSMDATPAVEGLHNGGVMIGCGCYHAYRYRVHDPAGALAGLGETMDVYVPVGGQVQVMSIGRYNAMANAAGGFPTITVPYRVGDPASYPSTPETIEGRVIQQEDLVFTPGNYRVSDTATVSWRYTIGETESNSVSTKVYAAALAEATVSFGIGVGVKTEVGVGTGEGYTISVGDAAVFSGAVPPIRDDPNTPEDEYALYNYGFSPIVYRQRYVDHLGAESGYFVQTYTAAR